MLLIASGAGGNSGGYHHYFNGGSNYYSSEFKGVTIYVERMVYTDKSTISNYYVTSPYSDHSLRSGYFLEPAWCQYCAETSGSDRAIRPGAYEVSNYSSAKYPNHYEVAGVPGRDKILIHIGNHPGNTAGCFLPGYSYSKDWVSYSGTARDDLHAYLKKYGGNGIRIIIKN